MQEIGIIGAGTMGRGIAQVAATHGHQVYLLDQNQEVLDSAQNSLKKIMSRLVEKGKLETAEASAIQERISYVTDANAFAQCSLIIEAVVERLEVKKTLFEQVEGIVSEDCILASNTSSLSIASIASACQKPERVVGIHFFNPAPLMPLVEIIPALQTEGAYLTLAKALIDSWGKTTVIAKDTPGFIVNKVARPFYGEALRIAEEGIASYATIDWAMKTLGGFRMGPFELMDLIGNDVNYAVTTTVFEAFYYDPRYRPAFTQKRLTEAGYLGKKTGRGYYKYTDNQPLAEDLVEDEGLGNYIVSRIRAMLINEAADTLHYGIATAEDIETAMQKGVNYPKGLLQWCDELGVELVVEQLQELIGTYGEDRYRVSPNLLIMAAQNKSFF